MLRSCGALPTEQESMTFTAPFQWPQYGHGPSGITRTRRANVATNDDTPTMHHEVCTLLQGMHALQRDLNQHCDASCAGRKSITPVEANNMPNAMHPSRAPLSRFGNLTMPDEIIRERRLHAARLGSATEDLDASPRFFGPQAPVREVEIMKRTAGPRPIVPVLLPALQFVKTRKSTRTDLDYVDDVEPDSQAHRVGADAVELQHFPGYKCRMRDMCLCHAIADAYHAEFVGVKRMQRKRHDHVTPHWGKHDTLTPAVVKSINCDMCATRIVGRRKDVKGNFFMCRKCKSKNNRYELCEKCHESVQNLLTTSKHFQGTLSPTRLTCFFDWEEEDDSSTVDSLSNDGDHRTKKRRCTRARRRNLDQDSQVPVMSPQLKRANSDRRSQRRRTRSKIIRLRRTQSNSIVIGALKVTTLKLLPQLRQQLREWLAKHSLPIPKRGWSFKSARSGPNVNSSAFTASGQPFSGTPPSKTASTQVPKERTASRGMDSQIESGLGTPLSRTTSTSVLKERTGSREMETHIESGSGTHPSRTTSTPVEKERTGSRGVNSRIDSRLSTPLLKTTGTPVVKERTGSRGVDSWIESRSGAPPSRTTSTPVLKERTGSREVDLQIESRSGAPPSRTTSTPMLKERTGSRGVDSRMESLSVAPPSRTTSTPMLKERTGSRGVDSRIDSRLHTPPSRTTSTPVLKERTGSRGVDSQIDCRLCTPLLRTTSTPLLKERTGSCGVDSQIDCRLCTPLLRTTRTPLLKERTGSCGVDLQNEFRLWTPLSTTTNTSDKKERKSRGIDTQIESYPWTPMSRNISSPLATKRKADLVWRSCNRAIQDFPLWSM